MIKRKEKYETPHFVFWITEYDETSHYEYDFLVASKNVAPEASKEQLKALADFINNFLEKKNDSSRIA